MSPPYIEVIDRQTEASGPVVQPSWDTIWQVDYESGVAGFGDWAPADALVELGNAGGLRAQDPLGTAVLLQLFHKKRRLDGLPETAGEVGGWHGDTYDIDEDAGEGPLGSWLWTLAREAITRDTLKLAEYFAAECLQTLVKQKVAEFVETSAEVDNGRGWLLLHIRVYRKKEDPPYQVVVPAYQII